jgi:hypothetical protein
MHTRCLSVMEPSHRRLSSGYPEPASSTHARVSTVALVPFVTLCLSVSLSLGGRVRALAQEGEPKEIKREEHVKMDTRERERERVKMGCRNVQLVR